MTIEVPVPRQVIIRNAAKCLECDEVIESNYTHDWVACSGGHIYVDGGRAYLRHGILGRFAELYEDLSITEERPGGWNGIPEAEPPAPPIPVGGGR